MTYTVDGISENDVIPAGDTATLNITITMGQITSDELLKAVQANSTLLLTTVAEFEQA